MKRLLIIVFVLLAWASKTHANESKDLTHIYLNFTTKEVCSNRANKCWPVALGNKNNRTPFIEGPTYIITHYKNGFNWKNPFTGQVYKKGTHNLGNIWIQVTTTSKGIAIGFHQTPSTSIPLKDQESLGGCIRMNSKDIKEFSNSVQYFDKLYMIE